MRDMNNMSHAILNSGGTCLPDVPDDTNHGAAGDECENDATCTHGLHGPV